MSESASGVLSIQKRDGGFLRDPDFSFQPDPNDVWVSPALIKKHALVEGASVSGPIQRGKKGMQLESVETVCGRTPEEFASRTRFDRLIAINPEERFRLGDDGVIATRVIELIAPIGKGTRGLIVAPPKSGKTTILEQLAKAIHASEPDIRIVALLIDERPEEVTHFRRSIEAEVLSSSSDQNTAEHVALAELTMAHIRCELECGHDVVVLIDSVTRLTRAFNLQGRGAQRTMSGGIDAKAMEIPRRFFGLARNIENGGSVTVIATALIDTGSLMDDYIFEEFKSTGNSELVLNRELAEARIYPAIDLIASGTRKEELLYSKEEMRRLTTLRRWLASGKPDQAMRGLIKLMGKTETNDELLKRLKPT